LTRVYTLTDYTLNFNFLLIANINKTFQLQRKRTNITSATRLSFVTGKRNSKGSALDSRDLAFWTSINLRKTY